MTISSTLAVTMPKSMGHRCYHVGREPRPRRASIMLKELAREYWSIHPFELAAALSYYTLLSLAPLLLMSVAVAGLVFDRAVVEGRIVNEMRILVGPEGSEVVETVLRHTRDPHKGRLSVIVGISVLFLGATSVFVQLQMALNRIWKVEESPHANVLWVFVKDRLLSLAMVLGVGFLLLVSLLVSAAIAAVGESAVGDVSEPALLLKSANLVVSLLVITILFAAIFKVLPDAQVAWREVWVGAVTTSVLFTVGKGFIGLYLGHATLGSPYGAAGSVVVMTVWVYYASLIVLFGAELTYVRCRRRSGA